MSVETPMLYLQTYVASMIQIFLSSSSVFSSECQEHLCATSVLCCQNGLQGLKTFGHRIILCQFVPSEAQAKNMSFPCVVHCAVFLWSTVTRRIFPLKFCESSFHPSPPPPQKYMKFWDI